MHIYVNSCMYVFATVYIYVQLFAYMHIVLFITWISFMNTLGINVVLLWQIFRHSYKLLFKF